MKYFTKAVLICALSFPTSSIAAEFKPVGKASWYKCCSHTANGEKYNPDGLTAAHRTLPFGTKVRVENLKTGQSVVVRINDRGPFKKHRIIDLSRGAAKKIGLIKDGVSDVHIEVIK